MGANKNEKAAHEVKKEIKKVKNVLSKDTRKIKKAEGRDEASAHLRRLNGVGNRLMQARQNREISSALKMARFLACIADPTAENACRAPDEQTLRDTSVIALASSFYLSSEAGGRIRFFLSSSPRRPFGFYRGSMIGTANATGSDGATTFRFQAYDSLQGLCTYMRVVGLKATLWPTTNALNTSGAWADAPLPNTGQTHNWTAVGFEPQISNISQFPNSMQGNVNPLSKISCFLIQQAQSEQFFTGTSDVSELQVNAPFQWYPYETDSAPLSPDNNARGCFHVMSIEGLPPNTMCFVVRLEMVLEVQPTNQILGQFTGSSSSRPGMDALEGVDDVLEHVRPIVSGNSPITPVMDPTATPSGGVPTSTSSVDPQRIVKTMSRAAMDDPTSVTDSVADMITTLSPIAESVGGHVLDFAKEYGPDILEAGLDLIPGGGVATNLAKWGLKAWNAFS